MSEDLKGKSACVLGGTSSIGLQTAILLSKNGIKVTAFGRKIPSKTEENQNIEFVSCNLDSFFDDENSKENQKILNKIKNCDIFVNCYGPFIQKSIEETTFEHWKNMALQNYALNGFLISSVIPNMKKNHFGRIVLFGGTRTESVKAYKTTVAYSGAKTALSVLVKSAASLYADDGITVNEILPGFTRNVPENTKPVTDKMLAEKVLFLIQNDELNGTLINVDRAWNP